MTKLSPFNYNRRTTNKVTVGHITIGGASPIRVQSMANSNTNDIEASIAQAIRIKEAGGDLVRFTTQGIREAQSLKLIHEKLQTQGVNIPLVADIHFNPKVAEEAAQFIEKVRINPGNFVAGKITDYTDEEFAAERDKVHEKLRTLINICKQHKTAIRIGVNHGSLSARMMNRYGDTPEGLVASCMEFLELCQLENFHDIVISIKASNTLIMVQAVRLLVQHMDKAGFHYPLHLGVTEAGEGEDGRIKSAVGIGALLADGIGDTIRVSLSEDPEYEIPVATLLVEHITKRANHQPIDGIVVPTYNSHLYERRVTHAIDMVGGNNPPVVIATKKGNYEPMPEYIIEENHLPMRSLSYPELNNQILNELKTTPQIVLLHSNHTNPVGEMRAFFHRLISENITAPVIIAGHYNETSTEALQIKVGADIGSLLLDGFGDGILLTNDNDKITNEAINSIAFGVLQAARRRISRTEYISCPGCGRTLFDLQATVAKVKAATSHLKNLKIAVMGCIVNGPGEMADADYGYVGAAKGRVSLYRKNECIEKNIAEEEAVEKLLALIEKDKIEKQVLKQTYNQPLNWSKTR
ncbi:MAG TPA: (E)-4-hydroxy-3-methylbut-2-enyl-diphosphate synthase [Paludibacteraceae bacterium]|nr:(E)-4-hydroxy-3-methylbut-2-enyl-diphosphate synthase [Paludibacteraceae bacterium]HQB69369.1 (E)-4-hydroxy-3-methylbut-2-enyl-diphosphate synthase [Paludibacteraceae bacterium]HRS67670.1 (E)-4-hydroxy-3-methylbut-2-enyl-diphosphate synthase [Paludibacteraceae bacterium]